MGVRKCLCATVEYCLTRKHVKKFTHQFNKLFAVWHGVVDADLLCSALASCVEGTLQFVVDGVTHTAHSHSLSDSLTPSTHARC